MLKKLNRESNELPELEVDAIWDATEPFLDTAASKFDGNASGELW